MKADQLIIIGAAGLALYMLSGMSRRISTQAAATTGGRSGTASSLNGGGTVPAYTYQITNNAQPGDPGYGWRYYSDGTSIDPAGNYYSGGNLVYQNPGMMGVQS